MIWSNGSVHSKYEGIVWNGNGRAGVGFHHFAKDKFENKILHRHEAYIGFTKAGILMGKQNPFATSESTIKNCWFEKCEKGISIIDFNYYNEVVEACEFRECGIGIHCTRWGQVFARDCHFERSRISDFVLGESHKHSVRRCTSIGSNQFLTGQAATLQNCVVKSWKNKDCAIYLTRGFPILMFDCIFEDPPSNNPPVKVHHDKLPIISLNNSSTSKTLIEHVKKKPLVNLIEIDDSSKYKSGITAKYSGFNTKNETSGKLFDAVKDFGANPKKGDSTRAIQATIDAAAKHGQGAIAYIPAGNYKISETLKVSGKDFIIGGTGSHSEFKWLGSEGGVLMEISNAENLTLKEFHIIGHSTPKNMIGILHKGGKNGSSVTYDRVWVANDWQSENQKDVRGIHFNNLNSQDKVVIKRLNGSASLNNSSQAYFLADFWDSGPIVIQGEKNNGSGFTGILNANGNRVEVHNNNSLIIGEYYCEQAKETIFKFSGQAAETPGRVTIGAARLHGWAQMKNFMEVNGFSGQVGYLHGHITKDRSAEHYNLIQSQTGKTQFLFAANSHNYFKFENNQKSTLHLLLNGSKDFKNKFSDEVFMRAIYDFRILSEEAMKRFEK